MLPVGHPDNPSRSTDPGWFGDCRRGMYFGTSGDYCLKYCNAGVPLELGQEVQLLMYKVLPGKTFRFEGVDTGCAPKEGYDSHMSPGLLEWYLPLKGQSCPAFVLTVKAVRRQQQRANNMDDGQANPAFNA